MQARPRVWIPTIIMIFVAAFLLGFAPIRRVDTGGFAVDSLFAFNFAKPLVETDDEAADRESEIRELLEGENLELDHVTLLEHDLLEVETVALDQAQADKDHDTIVKALKEKYGALSDTQLPGETEEQEPAFEWGPFALYPPVPQLKLGLDLQGGAHVVLRCLPRAEMAFESPEDRPLVRSAEPEEKEGEGTEEVETPGYQPPHTAETLKAAVRDLLAGMGAKRSEVSVSLAGTSLLEVVTQPGTEGEAKRQQQAVLNYLRDTYKGVDIVEREMSTVLVEAGTAEQVKYIIERRLYSYGEIREPVIQQQGDDRIIVEMPGVKDPQRVLDILKSTAELQFRLVPERYKLPDRAVVSYDEWRDEKTGQMVNWDQVRA
jgi:hypothetical protein